MIEIKSKVSENCVLLDVQGKLPQINKIVENKEKNIENIVGAQKFLTENKLCFLFQESVNEDGGLPED